MRIVKKPERTPAYKRIQLAIVKRIESGELKPGDAVLSERELARCHRVSLMTARHALADLERDGTVERRRGAGTFVAHPKIHFNKLMGYNEQMSARSLAVSSRVLSLKVIDNESEIAARLLLPSGARLLKLDRLRVVADEPFAIETCYMSAEDFAGLSRASLERGSLFSLLERDYGFEISYADEEIDATLADPQVERLLALPHGIPLLRIRQIIYSTKGRPTLHVLGLYRGDRHTLCIRRYR